MAVINGGVGENPHKPINMPSRVRETEKFGGAFLKEVSRNHGRIVSFTSYVYSIKGEDFEENWQSEIISSA